MSLTVHYTLSSSGQAPRFSLMRLKIWQKIQIIPGIKSENLMFDLVNEPSATSGERLTAKQAFDMQIAVIKALHTAGFNGKYLVEGVHFSGLHSWNSANNASIFTRDNFKKAGLSDNVINKQLIINIHQYLDSNFSGTHNTCQSNIMTTGENGFNLKAFVDYLKANELQAMVTEFGVGTDQASCNQPLNDFLTFLKDNTTTRLWVC